MQYRKDTSNRKWIWLHWNWKLVSEKWHPKWNEMTSRTKTEWQVPECMRFLWLRSLFRTENPTGRQTKQVIHWWETQMANTLTIQDKSRGSYGKNSWQGCDWSKGTSSTVRMLPLCREMGCFVKGKMDPLYILACVPAEKTQHVSPGWWLHD